jgi:hypothetical protein
MARQRTSTRGGLLARGPPANRNGSLPMLLPPPPPGPARHAIPGVCAVAGATDRSHHGRSVLARPPCPPSALPPPMAGAGLLAPGQLGLGPSPAARPVAACARSRKRPWRAGCGCAHQSATQVPVPHRRAPGPALARNRRGPPCLVARAWALRGPLPGRAPRNPAVGCRDVRPATPAAALLRRAAPPRAATPLPPPPAGARRSPPRGRRAREPPQPARGERDALARGPAPSRRRGAVPGRPGAKMPRAESMGACL